MPIILIIVGVIAAFGLGAFFYTNQSPADTPAPVVTEVAVPETAPIITTTTNSTTTVTTQPAESLEYVSGEYKAEAMYTAPSRAKHNVGVTLTLTNDIVTDAAVTFSGDEDKTSAGYQAKFTAAYKAQVIGKSLDSISLSRVGGASLSTGAFNTALATIKADAKS